MTEALFMQLLRLIRLLPRGGFRVVRLLAMFFPTLRRWPIRLALISEVTLFADLRESIWFPLWKFGLYPHQIAEDKLAQLFLKSGDCVWDVGANIGYTTLLYAASVGEEGQVIAFEPSPKAFSFLSEATSTFTNVQRVNCAVSDINGSVFFSENTMLDCSSIVEDDFPGTKIEVRATSLDNFLENNNEISPPVFLKIDVEGHEEAVFCGAKELIGKYKPIIEFEALGNEALRRSLSLIQEIGGDEYKVYQITHDGRLQFTLLNRDPIHTSNFLALRKDHMNRFDGVEFV